LTKNCSVPSSTITLTQAPTPAFAESLPVLAGQFVVERFRVEIVGHHRLAATKNWYCWFIIFRAYSQPRRDSSHGAFLSSTAAFPPIYLMDEAFALGRAQRTRYVARIRKATEPCSQLTTTLRPKSATASKPLAWAWGWCDCSRMQATPRKQERRLLRSKTDFKALLGESFRRPRIQGKSSPTRPQFGGLRWWCYLPACGPRAALVMARRKAVSAAWLSLLGCRHCHGLDAQRVPPDSVSCRFLW
jgi:hypothetical protein